ncbi:biotin--[acetyl-CoA-carboxylase] ligase [Acinetobacter genomosp. 15BJ]|uniref:biotin--[biotin carboxyl-carrier protein] ligase n=1 Tax=Acinetobacter genomosp. 15BJ TaxID=106651 RepID=R9AZP6_9GAMM|nr:biotin--[acetyl-CoA-carboxylase] ligase [Acinetobacter genomosp. 15BJ]EOR05621.1 biotin-[acetyl-CoA-carboxylase] ligase [Acinetobacter genomosp. 15BJ]MCH7290904.1 biotin--[acetyl-CoA-carboxylase] ligase [Acinetobacter genomosp. 15BJ]MDO3655930.1 biotin--[acetyl-CoA-carboxylase] ligase [Acinetobacter genomosp. 15BJ]
MTTLLVKMMDDFATRQLQQLLNAKNQYPEVVLLKTTTTSTNDDMREIAQKGITTGLVCSALQTQGRGQHQRQWASPEGNIYLSTLIQSNTALDGRLALEVALNILQMPSLHGLTLQVKWPNDLYSPQGKWGGILVEPLSPHQAIVGVGINLNTPPVENSDQPISSLEMLGLAHIDRLTLIAELYTAIQQAAQWFEHGSYNLAERFNHHAIWLNQQVEFEHTQGKIQGLFQGISNDGAVLIKTDQTQQFYQGRLRLASI